MLNDLILLIYQLFVLSKPPPHSLEVSTLIQLCAALQIKQGAVRTAMSRLKSQGFFNVTKTSAGSFYAVTPKMLMAREAYNKKVFIGEDVYLSWDDQWWLLCFAFASKKEKERNLLRILLKDMDFGCLHRGVWLKPVDPYLWLERELESHKLLGKVDVFTTKIEPLQKAQRITSRIWNLAKTAKEYDKYQERLREWLVDYPDWDEENCFIQQMKLFNDFTAPLIKSPLFPPKLFPENWQGIAYRELFNRINERLMLKSGRYVKSLISSTEVS